MNILLIAPQPFYQERGTPIAVKLLAKTLGEQGHTVQLLVYHEGEEIEIPSVTIHRSCSIPGITNIKPGFSLKKIICDVFMFFKCITLLNQHKFALIHAVEESVFWTIALKKIYKIPYVYDMDSCMSMQIIDKLPFFRIFKSFMVGCERFAVQNSLAVLTVCRSLQRTASKHAPSKHIAVIEDISLLDKNTNGHEQLRKDLAIEGLIIMYVGNLEKYQGIQLLLDSFKHIHQNNKDLNLICIGGNAKDILYYKKQTKKLNIASQTFFCGPRPVNQLRYYLNQADILISPRMQGNNTPMKIYSYLDSGKPIVATDLPTHNQVLDSDIAVLTKPIPEEIAKGILTLANNPQMRQTISQTAKSRVLKEYSTTAFQRKLYVFYSKVASDIESIKDNT